MAERVFAKCICPGCGTIAMKRPLEESDADTSDSFCSCGYEVPEFPYRLPSVEELLSGEAGGPFDKVDPALMKAAGLKAPEFAERTVRTGDYYQETVRQIWNVDGWRYEVGPDPDGLGLVELRYIDPDRQPIRITCSGGAVLMITEAMTACSKEVSDV